MDNNSARIVSNNTITEGGNEIIINIGANPNSQSKLENEINRMLDVLVPPKLSQRCIYRVPKEIRKANEEAYTPRIVSIGPFHHNNPNLESMEQVKKIYMKKLVQRSGNSYLKNCIDFVKKMEEEIRDYYSEHIDMDSDELVKMIVVDSCFIIQYLISNYECWANDDDHSLSLEQRKKENISLDLILFENQVPFFVLEGLFSQANYEANSILGLACRFFAAYIKHNYQHNFQSIKHFTHLVLILYRPPPREQSPSQVGFQSLYSSTDLSEAGVRFREKKSELGLFDIIFNNGVLEIPSLSLDDDTEIKIRNLMALEELYENLDHKFVTDYFVFMDYLINTVKDVELLVNKKIIINDLGDNRAAESFFNNLCINILYNVDNFYFSHVCKKLNDYYEVPWHKLMAVLKRDYFKTPWKTAATIAAITLLVLTLIQTVCTIMSTVNDNKATIHTDDPTPLKGVE